MFKRIGYFLFRNPEEIGFDNFIVLILSVLIIANNFLAAIINVFLQFNAIAIYSTLISALVILPFYLYSRIKNKFYISKFVIVLITLLILNIQWFFNFGTFGALLYFFVILESFVIIIFQKTRRLFFLSLILVNVSILFYIEFRYPELFGKYANPTMRLMDLYFGMLIYLFITLGLLSSALHYFIRQKEKAQLADKLKSAFLANMSHEIRTPMNGILGFTELLKNNDLTNDERDNYVHIIENSGARLLNIINDIIDISKIESGLIQVNTKTSNINEILEQLYSFFYPEINKKGMKFLLNTSLPNEEVNIKTDYEKLFAILTNLIKNAIKYSDQGEIEIGYVVKDSFVEFFVKDTGIGIPEEKQSLVFERFMQADIEDKLAKQGAGLGLSITKAYVQILGGNIWVKSEPGKGSAFYFTIPYLQEKLNVEKKTKTDEMGTTITETPKLKILVAEDDKTSVLLLSVILQKINAEITTVYSGKDAVDAIKTDKSFDLILMDVQMPVMGGYEAVKKIREFNQDIIIIAQTAYGLSGDREKAIGAGCNDYISKPIDKEKLLNLINRYFSI